MTPEEIIERLKRPLSEDEREFGIKRYVYCNQHLYPHLTGWCSVSNRNKFLLNARSQSEAIKECDKKGYIIFEVSRHSR